MRRKSLIGIIVGGLCLTVMLSVLVVGLVEDIWPWDGYTYYNHLDLDMDPVTGDDPEVDPGKDPAQDVDPEGEGINGDPEHATSPTLPREEDIQVTEGVDVTPGTTDSTGEETKETEKDTVVVDGNRIPGFLN